MYSSETSMTSSPLGSISPRSLPKHKFTLEDDNKLIDIIQHIGTSSWDEIAKRMGNRNKRQCKERWENYLSPEINSEPFTEQEDNLLLAKVKEIGTKWVALKKYFNKRTDAALKYRWQLLDRKIKKQEKLESRRGKQCHTMVNKPSPAKVQLSTPVSEPVIGEFKPLSQQPMCENPQFIMPIQAWPYQVQEAPVPAYNEINDYDLVESELNDSYMEIL
ncbi:RNA polymerase II transcription regulator recruiting protein [Trichomonas vaginalis G3]|nr:RNA polymerase II transcription regulator recruiting protein [Trichomonas vaginalis G3]KAI5495143.1 RNA polymerase II transcription regulator recruiting protein [Trichomonas vaginalis G3]